MNETQADEPGDEKAAPPSDRKKTGRDARISEDPGDKAQRAYEESLKKAGKDSKGPASKARRFERRREKIRDEIARNRRGEYTVPTWVLVLILVALVGGWTALVVFA